MALQDEQQRRVNYLVQKGKTLEKHIDTLKTYADSPTIDPINANLRLTNLTTLYKEYVKYNDELMTIQPDHPRVDAFFDIESKYYDIATRVTKLQTVNPVASSTLNPSNITIVERQDLPKLPVIQLPTFDGKREEWLIYKNRFIDLVHSRADLSNYVKHTQLLNSLSGSAKTKIVEFIPGEEDYPKAWQALLDSYDHKRIVVVEHLNAILDLPKLSNATSEGLSQLLDTARQHLHMLKRLEARPSDEIVVRIIERCLPPATRNRWQDKLELDSLPKLEELFNFIQASIFRLQANEDSSSSGRNSNLGKKRVSDKIDKVHNKVAKVEARSLITAASNSSTCLKCNEEHHLFKCPDFNKIKISERWDFVRSNKLCRNCLHLHPFPCKSEKRCKKCEKDHHTLLHTDKKLKSTKSEKPQTEGDRKLITTTNSQS